MGGVRTDLICFRLGTAVLMTNPVFVEQFGHFFGNHIAVVRD